MRIGRCKQRRARSLCHQAKPAQQLDVLGGLLECIAAQYDSIRLRLALPGKKMVSTGGLNLVRRGQIGSQLGLAYVDLI